MINVVYVMHNLEIIVRTAFAKVLQFSIFRGRANLKNFSNRLYRVYVSLFRGQKGQHLISYFRKASVWTDRAAIDWKKTGLKFILITWKSCTFDVYIRHSWGRVEKMIQIEIAGNFLNILMKYEMCFALVTIIISHH